MKVSKIVENLKIWPKWRIFFFKSGHMVTRLVTYPTMIGIFCVNNQEVSNRAKDWLIDEIVKKLFCQT